MAGLQSINDLKKLFAPLGVETIYIKLLAQQQDKGAQGAGFTLEALLGVSANAKQSPDKHGYEIKAHGGSRISLMTPSPDGGHQGSHSFREFMDRFGSDGKKGDGSRRFARRPNRMPIAFLRCQQRDQ